MHAILPTFLSACWSIALFYVLSPSCSVCFICNIQDLRSLTRAQPMFPGVEAWSPNHWTTREFLFLPHLIIIYFIYLSSWVRQYYFIDSSLFLFKNLSIGLGFKSDNREPCPQHIPTKLPHFNKAIAQFFLPISRESKEEVPVKEAVMRWML